MDNIGRIIWLTGIPCSGKTTISKGLAEHLKTQNIPVEILDGDAMRATANKDLSFSKKDRMENIMRAAITARNLAAKGITVIAAFVSPYKESRQYPRSIYPNFTEVYLKCDIKECMKRDTKGMYKKALAGEIKNFTGVDDVYEEPEKAEITLETDKQDIEICLNQLKNALRVKNG